MNLHARGQRAVLFVFAVFPLHRLLLGYAAGLPVLSGAVVDLVGPLELLVEVACVWVTRAYSSNGL